MTEQTYTYQHKSYDLDQAYYYVLLILINNNTFSYAVSYKNQLMAYSSSCALAELTNPVQLHELLHTSFKKIIVGQQPAGFSLVPTVLFNNDYTGLYGRLLDVKHNEMVLTQPLDGKNQVIYKLSHEMQAMAARYATNTALFGPKGWITAIAKHTPQNNQLYINVRSTRIELLYFKDGDIRFYNGFAVNTPEDVVYFTALIIDELELKPSNTVLIASGNVAPGSKVYVQLSEFFPDVIINKIQPLELPEEIAPQNILALASLILCE